MKKNLDDLSLTPPAARPVVDPHAAQILASLPAGVSEVTPQRRKEDQADTPWSDLTGVMPKGLNLRLDPELYTQMVWLTNNVPKMSLQKIVMAGLRAEVERMLDQHYYKRVKNL